MINCIKIAIVLLIFFMAAADVHAVTRDELIEKVIAAGEIVKHNDLKTAIHKIEDLNGPYVWHNNINYIFLMDINGKMLAHPFQPDLKKSDNLLGKKDKTGKFFIRDFTKVAKSANGMGWVRYMWPLPGGTDPVQKYTFVYRIPDTDYFLGSGFYVIKPGEYY